MNITTQCMIILLLTFNNNNNTYVSGKPVATRAKSRSKNEDPSIQRDFVIDKKQHIEVKEKTFRNVFQKYFGEKFDVKNLHQVKDQVFEYIDENDERRDKPFVKSNEALKRKGDGNKHKRFENDRTKTMISNIGESEKRSMSTSSLSTFSEYLSVPKTTSIAISSIYPKSKTQSSQAESSTFSSLSTLLIPTSSLSLHGSSERFRESGISSTSGGIGNAGDISSSSSLPTNLYLPKSYSSVQSYTPSSKSSLAWYPIISSREQSSLPFVRLTSSIHISPSAASLGDESDSTTIPSNYTTSQILHSSPSTTSSSSMPRYTSSSTSSSSTWTSSTSSSAQSSSTFKVTSSSFHLTTSSLLLSSLSSSSTSSSSTLKLSSLPSSTSLSSTSSSSSLNSFKSSSSVPLKASTTSSSSSSSSSISSFSSLSSSSSSSNYTLHSSLFTSSSSSTLSSSTSSETELFATSSSSASSSQSSLSSLSSVSNP